jgi:hypothetical protein
MPRLATLGELLDNDPSMRTVALLVLVVATGCASNDWQPLAPGALAASQSRTIVFALMRPGDLFVTGSGAIASPLAPAVSAHVGRDIIAKNAVVDPGLRIGRGLVEALARRYNLEAQPERLTFSTRSIWDHYNVDLVLAARTESWRVEPLEYRGSRCGVWYHTSVELYDARRRLTLARGDCNVETSPSGALTTRSCSRRAPSPCGARSAAWGTGACGCSASCSACLCQLCSLGPRLVELAAVTLRARRASPPRRSDRASSPSG